MTTEQAERLDDLIALSRKSGYTKAIRDCLTLLAQDRSITTDTLTSIADLLLKRDDRISMRQDLTSINSAFHNKHDTL